MAAQLVLLLQLRETVPLHAERPRRPHDWKYVHYPHGDGGPDRHLAELYDLRKDPDELKNLINDPASASELEKLKELAKLMAATGLTPENDRMPIDEGSNKDCRIRRFVDRGPQSAVRGEIRQLRTRSGLRAADRDKGGRDRLLGRGVSLATYPSRKCP